MTIKEGRVKVTGKKDKEAPYLSVNFKLVFEKIKEKIGYNLNQNKDKEKAYLLGETIMFFDRLVFEEEEVKMVHIVLRGVYHDDRGILSCACFSHGGEKGEHYNVFVTGLGDWLKMQLEGEDVIPHLSLLRGIVEDIEEVLFFTEEELIIGIAAHEVRHRFQHRRLPEEDLFSRENLQDSDFSFMADVLVNVGNEGIELDAKIVEHFVATEYRLGNVSLAKIKDILTMTP